MFVVCLVIVLFSFDSSVTTALKCFLCIGLFLSVYLFNDEGQGSTVSIYVNDEVGQGGTHRPGPDPVHARGGPHSPF